MSEFTLDMYKNREGLVPFLLKTYDNWKGLRATIEEEWQATQNMIFATDAAQSVGQCASSTWRNNSHRGKIAQIRDNLHANYLSALLGNKNWLRWEASGATDNAVSIRKVVRAYMMNKLDLGGFEKVVSDLLYDYIDYGVAFATPVWENSIVQYEDPETGLLHPVVQYSGPKAVRLSPHDVTINPTATTIKDTPKFIRSIVTFGQLRAMAEDMPTDSAYRKAVDVMGDIRKMSSQSDNIFKDMNYSVQGFANYESYITSGSVELLTFVGTFTDHNGELHRNKRVVIADRAILLSEEQLPPMPSGSHVQMAGWRDRPDNLYSQSPLAKLLGLQFRIDKLENLKADAMDLAVDPPLMVKGDVDPFTWQPGEVVGADVDGSVVEISKNLHNIALAQNEIFSIEATMEELAGAPKQAMGFRTPGEKTAFEVQSLQTAGSRIFQQKIEKFEKEILEPLLNDMLNLARMYSANVEQVAYLDPDLNVEDFLEVTKEDLITSGMIRAVGSRHFLTKSQLLQEVTQLFNTTAAQVIQPHISSKGLALLFEDILGLDKYDVIRPFAGIEEQAEQQQHMSQLQEELAVSQDTSTDIDEEELYAKTVQEQAVSGDAQAVEGAS